MKLRLVCANLIDVVLALFNGSYSVADSLRHSPETLPGDGREDWKVWMWLADRLAADASVPHFPGAEVRLSYGTIWFRLPSGIIVSIKETVHPRSGWIRWEATVERDGGERALTEASTLAQSLRKQGFRPEGEGQWEDEG